MFVMIVGVVGVVFGYVVVSFLLFDVVVILCGFYGVDVVGSLSLWFVWWVIGLGIVLVGVFVVLVGVFF